MKRWWMFGLLALWLPWSAHAAELRIDLGHGVKTFHTAELLQRPD